MISKYWQFMSERMRYVEGLDPSEVRFHTFSFDGDTYWNYFHGYDKKFRENQWRALIKGVPAKYIISEPQPSFGYELDGRLFNRGTINCQQTIKELWKTGILSKLEAMNTPPQILEVGGGIGQIVYFLKQLLPRAKFVTIDVPISLLFAKKYLGYHLGDRIKDVRFYDNEEWKTAGINTQFDLVMNIRSFQEMTNKQVRDYVAFIREHLAGVFYSANGDGNPQNTEGDSVSKILAEHFDCTEVHIETGQAVARNRLDRLLDLSPRKLYNRLARKQDPKYVSHHCLCRIEV